MSSTASVVVSKGRDYLQLCRVSNLPTVWMNTVAAGVLSGGSFSLLHMSLLVGAVSAVYCGGMAMNDCLDCSLDAMHRPERPIPSGRVGSKEATAVYLMLFLCSLSAFAVAGGGATLAAGLTLVALVVIYNLSHNVSVWAILPMAGCRFMIYLVAGSAVSATLPLPLLMLAVVQFAYVMLLTLLARLEKRHQANGRALPLILVMLAGIPLIDGLALGFFVHFGWLAAGVAGGAATLAAQRKIRGD